MDEDELEQIKKRKLLELQMQREHKLAFEEEQNLIESQRQSVLRQILTPDARERLGRLKIVHPEITKSVENQLIALYHSGRLDKVIDDNTLYQILSRIVPRKKDITIERR